jgi:hypothetical protein
MNTTSKLVGIALAAAVAVGGFGILGAGESTPAFAAPAVATPAQPSAAVQATVEKPAADCAKEAWPYVARECLAAADGTPVRKVSRTITTNGR